MENVTQLHKLKPTPNQDVINQLEDLLKRAKSGEIQVLIGCRLSNELLMTNFISGHYKDQCINVVGMLADLQYDLLKIHNGDE